MITNGTKLGRYEIRSKIGAGGMGEVYLAQDTKLERTVALKILPANVAADRQRMQRFIQEAKAASGLNHPNILTVHEIEQIDSVQLIATELIDGETLRQHLNARRIIIAEALDVSMQIASALSAAHAAGIIHRDIKPENIMLRRDGIVKVLDFGLAKLIERFDSEREVDAEAATEALVQTEPGVVMGTAAYMSPEQARGKDVDARTDIFSLGAVIYEMLSGRAPFAGETAADIIGALIHKEPQPLSTLVPNIPAELQHIVSKALRKDRDERYQTVKSLLVDLKTLKQELDFSAKLERSVSPDSKDAAPKNSTPAATVNAVMENAGTQAASARPTSSAEYLVSRFKQRQRSFTAGLAVLLLAAIGFGYWSYTRRASNAAPIESLAVLPFVNESGNAEVEYLSDGITESLINSLSQLPKLSVKARSSVFRYKGKEVDPQQVAKELSVQAILNGRVVQRGEDLALYLSLVDARNGNQIWGEQYNRKLTDLVALQSEIARDVSSKLRARLSGADERKLAKNYTENVEAYQLYLKGRYYLARLRPGETQKGILYLQQAIAIDPNYALAYVGLANAYRALALSGDVPPGEVFPKAKAAAQKAVELDDSLAEAHAVLGFTISWYDWDWSAAENHFKRALELNPNSADAHWVYAGSISNLGRHAEALAEIKRARELDPLNLIINATEGLILVHAGRTDEGLAVLQKTSELDPNYWLAHLFASSAFMDKGMFAKAVAEASRARELSGVSSQPIAYAGYALAKSGKEKEARAELDELLKLSTQRYVPPYHIAFLYNGLNERDETLAWLERGYEKRDPKMVFLKVEPKWNNLRDDPRFQQLLRRMGFEP
jgi:serine/threonine protein kinase/tetratricopeptide (TPR) repeat protein